ncbi:MAG: carbon-nitrogen hydrolase family protein [Clostridiales bacterium]|nr:carbon-nitrogen hydrolase family protein [Clostridiales bacterium]
MEVCFVTKGTLNKIWQEKLLSLSKKDVVVFGFNGIGLVSYKKELAGETEYFQDVAKMSKQISSVVICGCDTDTYGVFRHSAVVADKGRILGVTDMAHSIDEGEFVAGGNFRVYDTSAGKIGVIIAEDLFFPETARVLTLCDADFIVCLFKKTESFMPQIMLRAGAFANGVAMALCAENQVTIADIKGDVALSSKGDFVNAKIKIQKDFHLISSRRRGLYREFNSGY